ncbi:MAG: hypothetical protein ACKOCD_02935 [Nitrospiraceae bacterium]
MLCGLATLAALFIPFLPEAQADVPPDQPDFVSILGAHHKDLASLASDAQAQVMFVSKLSPALDLKDGSAQGRQGAKPPLRAEWAAEQTEGQPQTEWAQTSLRLTGDLAAWDLASGLRVAAEQGDQALQALVRDRGDQHGWLTGTGQGRALLHRAFLLAETVAAFAQASRPVGESAGFSDYAAGLDRTLPLIGADESWVALAERAGATGDRQHLNSAAHASSGDHDRDRLAQVYFDTRLKPVLTAQVIASALRAEAEAERSSREAWLHLHTWRDRLREAKGLARLCGLWQWTIHNHQNHQDHKMMMRFDPPPSTQPGAPPQKTDMKPAKIVVLGDVVYLRWESAGGFQEDSLLFTGEGQRLEGSFVNSAGAWGSITGKRASACAK